MFRFESSITGTPPSSVTPETLRALEVKVVGWSIGLESELVKATPVGIGGNLRQAWSHGSAQTKDGGFVVQVTNSAKYLLPTELGRLPGKGISAEGQKAVALWAKRKLGLPDKDARSFGFLLSRQYQRVGRPAQGFVGLANKGAKAKPATGADLEPVQGGLLAREFKRLDALLS